MMMINKREQSVRIVFAPAQIKDLSLYGMSPQAHSGNEIDLMASAFCNANHVLSNVSGVSRYSNGDWSVLYTAKNIDTAIVEKGYWIINSIFKKRHRPNEVRCMEYALIFEGSCINYVGREVDEPYLVHPTNYNYCWSVAKKAKDESIDFLIVPSARRRGGVNINLFRRTEIFEITSCSASVFQDLDGTVVRYLSGSLESKVVIDDVFGNLGAE